MLPQQVLSHSGVSEHPHTVMLVRKSWPGIQGVTSTTLTVVGEAILQSPVWGEEALGPGRGELTTADEASASPLFCKDRGKAR